MKNWFKKLFRRKEAYVSYPSDKWLTYYKRTELYQLRIQPWGKWGKKDDGIMTYNMIHDPKEEFKAKLKGDATWIIKHGES